MGDRCYCYLEVGEPFSDELLALIEEEGPDADNDRTDKLVWFDEVNYAEIPPALKEYLTANKIPFAWWNDDGDEYGEGVYLFDGENSAEYPTLDGDIVLSVRSWTPEAVERAQKWQDFWNKLG